MTEKVDPKALKQPKDIVAQDRNWTLRVNSQLTDEQKWSNQWGFYEKGIFLLFQASLQRRLRLRKRKRSMIGLSSSKRKSTKSMEKSSIPLLLHMAKAIRWRSSKTVNTISFKIMISVLWNAGCLKAGRSLNGLLVFVNIFSCRSL